MRGRVMPADLGLKVLAILGRTGSQRLLHLGTLLVRLMMGSRIFMAAYSVRSSWDVYWVVVRIVVRSQAMVCPVVLA